ncbi:MAG: glycosyltransferase family 4 protein [Nanoarchaeota archaeon]
MRILELTTYSAGGCGVWARVYRESQFFAEQGHRVEVFSSDFIKGSSERAPHKEKQGGVSITRFPGIKLGGESFTYWNFRRAALTYKPDVIIAHAYRHTHTTKALSIGKQLGIPVFLVTHAPFDRAATRSWVAGVAVFVYDACIGKRTLPKFTKIVAITRWELPFLRKLGLTDSKIAYVPNGLPEEFFIPLKKEGKGIIYTGRLAPIKNLETVSRALGFLHPEEETLPSVVFFGPAEREYLIALQNQIKADGTNITIINETFNQKEQINELDKHEIFILPSLSEGLPQSLLEAMARGKIVIASNNKGNKDIIKEGKNGFLFPIGNKKRLAERIKYIARLSQKAKDKIRKSARTTAENYRWKVLGEKFLSLIKLHTK